MHPLPAKKPGPKPKHLNLQGKLEARGIDPVSKVLDLLDNPKTSDRIKADLLKDLLNYCYAKKKSVVIEDSNGQPITFNLQLGK